MPNHKSAEKRDRQRSKRRLANRFVIGAMRTCVSKARAAIEAKADDRDKLIKAAISSIDRAVSKGALKRNTASRYVSRLVRAAAKSS